MFVNRYITFNENETFMNILPIEKRKQILHMLVEGASMRSVSRVVGVSINTVTKLQKRVGEWAAEYQDKTFVNLTCKRLQCDEIWSFCHCKGDNIPPRLYGKEGVGDIWTWTSIDPDTKLIPHWLVGTREGKYATVFIEGLAKRLANRVQISTDGYSSYMTAIEATFGDDVDYGILMKLYENKKFYMYKQHGTGRPDKKHISTSAVERQNLTMRMSMRRFTRKTNAHSKKIDHHRHALAMYFLYYNFIREHSSLGMTPAKAAGIAGRAWTWEEVIGMI